MLVDFFRLASTLVGVLGMREAVGGRKEDVVVFGVAVGLKR